MIILLTYYIKININIMINKEDRTIQTTKSNIRLRNYTT